VIGVGNRRRSDDAAGLEVVARLRQAVPEEVELLEREGEPTSLIDAWRDADAVWVVDAVSSGAQPGTLHRLDAIERELPGDVFRTSTHHLGLAEAVELGDTLSPEVADAVGRAADAVRGEVLASAAAR
jgi:hydrogenase maturation protease